MKLKLHKMANKYKLLCLDSFLITLTLSMVLVIISVLAPVTIVSAASPVFSDNFDTGAKAGSAGGYGWTGGGGISVSTDTAQSGSHSLRFQFTGKADCEDSTAQQPFTLNNLPEVWIEYYFRVPYGAEGDGSAAPFYHRSQSACGPGKTPTNNKFLRVWGTDYNDNDPKFGASFTADGTTGNSNLYIEWNQWKDNDTVNFLNSGQPLDSRWYPWVSEAASGALKKGQWNRIQWHGKLASADNIGNGLIELWVNNVLKVSVANRDFFPLLNPPYFTDGYLMGAANSGYTETTNFYIDDFKIYNTDPGWSGTPPPPAADTSAPTVPGGLSATAASTSQINLSWTASTDNTAVTGYRVYRNGVQIATTSGTSYSSTGLASGTSYTYTVSAYDAVGNLSEQSESVSATTDAPPPSPPPDTTPPTTLPPPTPTPITPISVPPASTPLVTNSAPVSPNDETGLPSITSLMVYGCLPGYRFSPTTGLACPSEVISAGQATLAPSPDVSVGTPTSNTISERRSYNLGSTTLRNGSRSEAVKELHRFLNDTLNLGLKLDGILGPKTIAVIRKWQRDNGLVSDGLLG